MKNISKLNKNVWLKFSSVEKNSCDHNIFDFSKRKKSHRFIKFVKIVTNFSREEYTYLKSRKNTKRKIEVFSWCYAKTDGFSMCQTFSEKNSKKPRHFGVKVLLPVDVKIF